MEQKIRRIGNSLGVLIPAQIIEELGLEKGDEVVLQPRSDQTMMLSKKGTTPVSISPKFMDAVDRVNKKYKKALVELAKK